jgi:antagonist of KipI
MALWVSDPGPLTTVQDACRGGYQRFGVPVSGAMDWPALRAANLLVGNPPGAAGLEFAFQGPSLVTDRDCLVSICGADCCVRVDERWLPGWRGVRVKAGQEIQAVMGDNASWGCLAISSGLDVPRVLGSAATYLRGPFGGLEGRALREGDWLFCQKEGSCPSEFGGSRLRRMDWLQCGQALEARVVPGPQADWFGEAGLNALLQSQFTIHAQSDRMGYRLEGTAIPRRKGDMLSEGMVMGSIQVPPNGQPIVMMADRPTTGGYPKIGTVIRADLPRLAQLRPGSGKVRFAEVTVAQAQQAYRELIGHLNVELDADELWMQA